MQKSLITRLSKQCNYNSQTLPIISNYESSISMSFSERSSEIDTTRENMPDISSSQSIHNVTIDFQSNTCKPIKLCFVVQVYVRVLFLRQKSYSSYSNNLLEANKRPTKAYIIIFALLFWFLVCTVLTNAGIIFHSRC